jgi:hypothetical protein
MYGKIWSIILQHSDGYHGQRGLAIEPVKIFCIVFGHIFFISPANLNSVPDKARLGWFGLV